MTTTKLEDTCPQLTVRYVVRNIQTGALLSGFGVLGPEFGKRSAILFETADAAWHGLASGVVPGAGAGLVKLSTARLSREKRRVLNGLFNKHQVLTITAGTPVAPPVI